MQRERPPNHAPQPTAAGRCSCNRHAVIPTMPFKLTDAALGRRFVYRGFTLLCFACMRTCELKTVLGVPSIEGGPYANHESHRRCPQKRR